MRLFFTPLLALFGTISPAAASPLKPPHYHEITARQVDAAATPEELFSSVTEKTSSINDTLSSLTGSASPADITAATNTIAPLLTSLQGLVDDASSTFANSGSNDDGLIGGLIGGIGKRQADALATLTAVTNEIAGTVKETMNGVGVENVRAQVEPLVTSVSGLGDSLQGIVSGAADQVNGILGNTLAGLGLDGLLDGLLGGLLGGLGRE